MNAYDGPAPTRIRVAQYSLWAIAFAVVLQPWSWNDASHRRLIFTSADEMRVVEFTNERLARNAAPNYPASRLDQDRAELLSVRDLLSSAYKPSTRTQKSAALVQAAQESLYSWRAARAEASFLEGKARTPENLQLAAQYGQSSMEHMAVIGRMSMNFQPSFLARPPETHFWRTFYQRWMLAWALTIPLAFVVIGMWYRSERQSLLAKIWYEPWHLMVATVCWFYGLHTRPTFNAARCEFHRLRRQREKMFKRELTEYERQVLNRQASERLGSFEDAKASLQAMPAEVTTQSRRAIFTGIVMTMLSGPIQMLMTVTQAFANAARVSGVDSSLVDTTRVQRKRFAGFTDGNIETSSDGRRITTGGHVRGKLTFGNDGFFVHANARTLQPLEAYATTQLGNTSVQAGMVTPYPVFDYPAPWNALFRTSQGFDLLPSFSDFGMQAETRAGPITLQAGLVTGDGVNGTADNRTDGILRLSGSRGLLSASASYQGGDQHQYAGANLTLAGKSGSLSYEYARRNDDNPKLGGDMHQLEVVAQRSSWRIGFQLADAKRQTLLGVIERKLGGLNRMMSECLMQDGQGPKWTMRFQQGLKLATP